MVAEKRFRISTAASSNNKRNEKRGNRNKIKRPTTARAVSRPVTHSAAWLACLPIPHSLTYIETDSGNDAALPPRKKREAVRTKGICALSIDVCAATKAVYVSIYAIYQAAEARRD